MERAEKPTEENRNIAPPADFPVPFTFYYRGVAEFLKKKGSEKAKLIKKTQI
jgi:hypothetical protein